MFMILLKFSDNKDRASEFMQAHNQWIKRGFDDGVFLLVGSLQDGSGGCVVTHSETLEQVEFRIRQDPFVAEGIVSAETIEIEPKKVNSRLDFLLDPKGKS